MRHNRAKAVTLRQRNALHRLAQGADLVDLDEDGVARALSDTARQPFWVSNKEIIADQLHARARRLGERLPAFPVVLGQPVFYRRIG